MKKLCLLVMALTIFTVGTAMAGFIPAYSNVGDMGSAFSGSQVSMSTTTSQNPVTMGYSVSLSGVGTASAWINAHIMEGRTGATFDQIRNNFGNYKPGFWNYDTGDMSPSNGFMQGVDLVYKERTTASGVIQSFEKSMTITNMNSGFCTF